MATYVSQLIDDAHKALVGNVVARTRLGLILNGKPCWLKTSLEEILSSTPEFQTLKETLSNGS